MLAVDAAELLVALRHVVELERVVRLHEVHRLEQLVQVFVQDGVGERVDEVGEELDVGGEGLDGAGRDALDGVVEGEGLRWSCQWAVLVGKGE